MIKSCWKEVPAQKGEIYRRGDEEKKHEKHERKAANRIRSAPTSFCRMHGGGSKAQVTGHCFTNSGIT